ncbi:MAG: dephospho-CoA kinase [Helicobacteraceae bacterium]|nr:dephospho-CoA kinase [Helicobacteraceae bacterium]
MTHRFNRAIVITGGVATGKSTVAKALARRGFGVIDADVISHECFYERAGAIMGLFGTLDRAVISERVFASSADRAALEAILHPMIRERIFARATALEELGDRYFIDIPLFFEKKEDYPIANAAVVYAPRQTQIDRLMSFRAMSKEVAEAMIGSQLPIDEKRKSARWAIDNSADMPHLTQQLEQFLRKIGDLEQI